MSESNKGFFSWLGQFWGWLGQLFSADDPEEHLQIPEPVDELPPTPALPALPLQSGQGVTAVGFPLKIAIDFGTSACAVAMVPQNPFDPIELARLSYRLSGDKITSDYTIDSFLALPYRKRVPALVAEDGTRAPDFVNEPASAALGKVADALYIRETDLRSEFQRYHFHRSLKRMISDRRRSTSAKLDLVIAVRKMIGELLLLALFPERSGTCQASQSVSGGTDEQKRAGVADQYRQYVGFSNPHQAIQALCSNGIELYLSVPNAFGAFECDIIRQGGASALTKLCEWFLEDYLPAHLDSNGTLYGQTPAEIAKSLEPALKKDRPNDERVIREADAVAWWELCQQQRSNAGKKGQWNENWLVFDVGGGSTDAALMRVGMGQFHPHVRMLKHSGVTVAGNDVDELLSYATAGLAQARGGGTGDHLSVVDCAERQFPAALGKRAAHLREVAQEKVQWSEAVTKAIWNAQEAEKRAAAERVLAQEAADDAATVVSAPVANKPSVVTLWRDWLVALSKQASPQDIPSSPALNEPAFALKTRGYGLAAAERLSFGRYSPRYGRFLQAAVCAVCDDLFLNKDVRPQIDRVIVSGRGCQLPGVQQMLQQHLLNLGVIKVDTPVAAATSDTQFQSGKTAGALAMAMKLACVRGCAYAASQGGIKGLGFFVSQDVTLTIGHTDQSLWPAGTRVLDGVVASAVVRVPAIPTTLIDFYQRRFPKSIDRYFGASQPWNRRQISRVNASMTKPHEFLVQFDCGTWGLSLWSRPEGAVTEFQLISADQPLPRSANPENPVTGLKLDWADEERGQ